MKHPSLEKVIIFSFLFVGLVILSFITGTVTASTMTQTTPVKTFVGTPQVQPGQTNTGSFVFYCQGDPKWDDRSACGTGQVACGPTSLAMVMSSFGDIITPAQTFQLFKNNGWISCSLGSLDLPGTLQSSYMTSRGYVRGPNLASGGTLDAKAAKESIGNGEGLIIASSNAFPSYVSGKPLGHIFVVQDVDPEAKTVLLRDPMNCSYTTGEEVVSRQRRAISDFPWLYAYTIKKI